MDAACAYAESQMELNTYVSLGTSADEIINQLPNKIHSKLLKQGKNLSGGQIQKLLITKSLLKENAIIFWDEAFSNLDEQSKNKIYNNVLQNDRYSERTMLIISHHLSSICNCLLHRKECINGCVAHKAHNFGRT